MKQKLIITLGLPASGKSTWALQQVADSNGEIKRVNKDDLRAMIDAGKWTKEREKEIESIQEMMIRNYLAHGYTVIVDNTHLAPKWVPYMQNIADSFNIPLEIKDFTDVDVKICIGRDSLRKNPVGKKAINEMYTKWVKKAPRYTFGNVIICDIDGTLAHMEGRSPYDGIKVGEDLPDIPVITLVTEMRNRGFDIIFLSGRNEKYKPQTVKWLNTFIPFDYDLYMRAEDDFRCDAIVKKELFNDNFKAEDILFVLDDRDRVVNMWREMGLKCLQCEPGDF